MASYVHSSTTAYTIYYYCLLQFPTTIIMVCCLLCKCTRTTKREAARNAKRDPLYLQLPSTHAIGLLSSAYSPPFPTFAFASRPSHTRSYIYYDFDKPQLIHPHTIYWNVGCGSNNDILLLSSGEKWPDQRRAHGKKSGQRISAKY